MVADTVTDGESSRFGSRVSEQERILATLTRHPRPAVRRRAAHALASEGEGRHAFECLRVLAADRSGSVRVAAASSLAARMAQARGSERAGLLADWTLSSHAAEREAIARALAHPVDVMADDAALDLLCSDPEARVRRAAMRALENRFASRPGLFAPIAHARFMDPDRRVRSIAARLLAEAHGSTADA